MTNPRTEYVALRLTPREVAALTAHYGSAGKGLRVLLDSWMQTPDIIVAADPEPFERNEPSGHRHRRGVELDPTYAQGAKVRRWLCAEPGCDKVLS